MKILNISIKDQEGKKIDLQKALLIEEKGIDGDKNAKGGQRQISLLPSRIRKMINDGDVEGLCIKRYQENLTYSGENLLKGKIYKIGGSQIMIIDENKKCFPECKNIIDNLDCPLVENAIFAKIIKTGHISLNDEIEPF